MIGLTAILETQRQKTCSDEERQSKGYKERGYTEINKRSDYCGEGSREEGGRKVNVVVKC